MSKIGGKPVSIKEGVKVSIENGVVKVEGSKGNLTFPVPKDIEVKIQENRIEIAQKGKCPESGEGESANWTVQRVGLSTRKRSFSNQIFPLREKYTRHLQNCV